MTESRASAAAACLAAMDAAFLKALCEPARIEIVRRLITLGRADIAAIAEGLPQDRSVVSRHLQLMERAGIVIGTKDGRNVSYELDGPAILRKFSELTAAFASLVPLCCPGPARPASGR